MRKLAEFLEVPWAGDDRWKGPGSVRFKAILHNVSASAYKSHFYNAWCWLSLGSPHGHEAESRSFMPCKRALKKQLVYHIIWLTGTILRPQPYISWMIQISCDFVLNIMYIRSKNMFFLLPPGPATSTQRYSSRVPQQPELGTTKSYKTQQWQIRLLRTQCWGRNSF